MSFVVISKVKLPDKEKNNYNKCKILSDIVWIVPYVVPVLSISF